MRTETFFATIAQVLPTIMIALVIEMRIVADIWARREVEAKSALKRKLKTGSHTKAEKLEARAALARDLNSYRARWNFFYMFCGGLFMIGQVAALAGLVNNADMPYRHQFGTVAAGIMLILSALVVGAGGAAYARKGGFTLGMP